MNFSGGGTNVLLTQIGYHKFSSSNVYASNSLALRDDGVHGADFELGGFNTLGRNGVPEPVHNQPTWIAGTLAVSLTRGTNSILKFGASGFGGQADYNVGSATVNGVTVSGLKADTVTLGTSTYFQQTNFNLNDPLHYGAGITVPDTVSQSAGAAGAISAGTLNLLGVQFGTPGFSTDTFNAGNFQLNNPLNQVGTLAGRSNNTPGAIGTISYAQSTSFQLGNIAANQIVLSAGGAVTQLGGTTLVAQNAGLLLSGSGQYTLLNTGNAVSLLAANLGTGNGSFIKLNTSTTTISTVKSVSGVSADLFALNTPGPTTQAANAPIVTGALALTGTGSSFTFNNTSNQIGSIAANTGALSIVAGTGALTVATVNGVAGINASGNVSLFADQQIAATAPLHAGGSLTLANMTAGIAIDIGGTSLVAGHLNIRAADLKQISNSSLTIGRNDAAASGRITIAGNIDGSSVATGTTLTSLTLLTGGGVGEASNTIGVNTLNITANGAIVLDQANTVSSLSANAGTGNVTFANVGGFNIAGGITGNAVSLTSGGTVTQTPGAPILASSLELHDRGGGTDFELTEATNQLGATGTPGTLAAALTRSTNSVMRFADSGNGYVVGTINATAGITADTVALGSTGVVTQTGGISASALALSGAGGQFTLQGSNVVSALSTNLGTGNGSLVNFTNGVTGPFALGNLQADAVTLSLNGVTAVTQQAGTSIVTSGAFSITSQAGNYQLTNAGNQIGSLSANIGTGNGSFFAYNDSGTGYTLTGVTADTVALGATGIVTATGAVVTGAGGLALTGAGGDFTLINDLNVVSKLAANTGSLRVASGTVPSFSISAVNGITGVTATGDVTLYSDRPVTLSSPMSAGGTITLANQTAGVPIDIGGTVAVPGHFTLLAVDLKQIVASGLGVGRNDANASGAITILSNLNANSLADGSTLGTLNLLTGAGVTQGTNTISVNKVSVAAGGPVVLDQINTVAVFSANAGNNPVTFVSTSGFNVATGITGSAVSLTAGGTVTQSSGASVKATTLVLRDRGAGAAFELTDPTNQLGVTGTPGIFAAALTRGTSSVAGFAGNGNGFVVGTVNGVTGVTADTVKLGSSGGVVTQTADVTTDTLALSGAGGQFTLNNAGNVANTFSASLGTGNGSSVAFTDSVTTPVALGNLQADTVSLNLGAGSSTSQQAGTSIVVGGTFSLTGAGGTHQLTNVGNQAGALAVSIGTGNGSSFAFSDSGTGFVVSGVTADTVALASGGTVTQTGAIVTGTGANTGLALTGGGAFILNSANNQVSTLAASADQLYFANPGSYNIGSVGGVSGITSRIVELSSSGTVTQSSDINIDGSGPSLSFVGGTGNYQFTNAGNVINAPIIGSVGTAAISSVGPKITIGSAGLSATGTTTLYGKGFQFDGYVNSPNGITIANAVPANLFIGNNLNGFPTNFLNIPGNVFLFDNFGALSRLLTNSLTFGRNDANATSNLIIGNDFNISTLTLLSGGSINTNNSLITTNRLNAAAGGDILVNAGSTINGLGNITGAAVTLGSTVALTQVAGTALNVDSLTLVSAPSATLNNSTNRIGALAANFGTGSGHSLSVTSTGTVNSAGPIVVSDLQLSGSGTKYFLTNPGNQIPTFSANLGTGNGSALSLADTGTVGQSGAIVTDALSLSGAGQYTLTNGGNQIGSLAANLGVGNGSLLDIFSNGSVGSAGAVVVSNLVLRGGNFTLDNPGGAVDTLAVNAGSVNVWGGGSTTIGTLNGITGINSSGNFALSADTPVLANNINAAGTVTLANASPGRQFTVGDGASGTSINITQTEYNKIHAGALVLGRNDAFAAGQITIKGALAKGSGPGSLTLITGAGVGQQQSNTLFVTLQSLSVIANGDVGLAGSYNQLGAFSATTSGNVSLRDSSSTPLVIAGVTADSLTITAPQTVVKQSAPIRVNTLTLSTLGAFFGEFALDSESNQLGTAANPGTLNTDLILNAVNVPGFVYFADNGTGFKLGSTKAGYLDLYTTGTVTQSGNLNVLNLQLNGVGGNYQLTSGGNSIQGQIAANTGTVNIFNASGSGISTGSLFPGANAQHAGGASGITATGSVKIVTRGSFNVLGGSPITSQATGDAVVISAGSNFATNFINQSGAGGISAPNGRVLIFTNTVGGVSAGGLTAKPLYGTSYANYDANGIANAGNRFVYAQTETVTVTPTTNAGTILYDGQQHTLSNFTYSGLVAGDDPALALSGTPVTTAARNAGTNTVTATAGSLTSDYGYSLAFGTGTIVITPASLTVSAVGGSKVYDGTTASTITPTIVSGQLYGTDSLTEVFASRNVLGAGGSILTVPGVVNDGNGGGNYTLTINTPTAAGTITRAPLTVTAATVSRAYDGTTGTTVTPLATSGTVFSGDTANFSEVFTSKNVKGTGGSTLVASGSVLDGNNGGNYAVTFQDAAGTITAAPLTVSAATASRAYDGTTGTTVTPLVTSGTVFSGDTVSFSEAFTSKNVRGASGSTLVASGSVLDGNNGGNYAVTFQNAAGTITAAPLTVSAATATKVYDGTVGTTAAPLVTSGTVFSGDTANFAEAFTSKNVLGTSGSTLVASGSVSDSNGGNNYTVTFQGAAGTITAAALTVSAATATKVYDGTTGTIAAPQVTSGTVFSGDAANFSEVFTSKNVLGANGSTLIASGSVSDGNGGGNYTITFQTAAGTITAAPLTVSATTAARFYDGTVGTISAPQLTSGIVFSGDTANFSEAFASRNVLGTGGSTLVASGSVTDSNGGGNYALTFQNATGTITAAPLTVTATTAARVYDGTIGTTVTPLMTSGTVFNGDTANFNQAFTSKNVLGAGGSTLVASGSVADGNGGGNYAVTFQGATGTITAAPLTVSASGATKVYDGTTGTTASPLVTSGTVFSGDTANFVEAFTSKNVLGAGGSTLVASGSVSDSNGGNNYAVTFQNAAGTITATPLTVTATTAARSYDGTTGTTSAPQVTSGTVFSGDTANFSEVFASKNVLGAGGSTLVASGSVADSNGGGNYTITFQTATGTITAAPLTVTATTAARFYDGTTGTTSAPQVTAGIVFSGDTANFSEAFASKNVLGAGGSTLVASGSVADSNGGGNYAVTFQTATGTITAAPLTVSATTATKVYDGTTGTTTAPQVTSGTVFSGDTANFSEIFTSKNVMSAGGSTLVASGSVADSNGGGNYAITFQTTTGTITPAPLTVSATTATKVFDNTTSTTSTPQVTSGTVFAGDTANFSQAFVSKNAMGVAGSTLAATGSVTDGNGGNNYAVTFQNAPGTITRAPLTVAGLAGQDIIYNNSTVDPLSGTAALSGTTYGNVALAGSPTGAFADPNVGVNKPVTVSGLSLTGSEAGNYVLNVPTLSASIGAAALAVTVAGLTAHDIVYNGGTVDPITGTPVLTGTTFGNVALTGSAVGAFADPNVGTNKAVTVSGLSLTGTGAANYILTQPTLTASITRAALTVTANALSRLYGDVNPASGAATGNNLQGSDTISAVSLSSSASSTSGVGVYDLSASAVVFSTGLASNYNITYATNANGLTVAPRPVTVTAAAQSRIYGDGNPALTYVTSSLGAGVALSGSLSTVATATSNIGDYAITAGGVTTAANPNYIVSYVGNNLTVGQRPVTVTADSQTRIYGDINPAFTYATTSLGAGAALSGNLSTAANAASDVGDYAISAGGVTAAANPNYAISYVGSNLTVLQRSVTVTADAQSRVYGDANPLLTYSTTSLGAGRALVGTLATVDPTANAGNYSITRGSLTDAANANYAVTYVGNTLAIGQRALTITADAQSRVYTDANPATGTATGNNLRNGDSIAGVNLSSSASVTSNVGNYDLTASAASFSQGLASNYTVAYATRSGGLSVTPRPLTVTADAQSRIYGDANPALTYVVGGLVNGDALAGTPVTAAVATSNVGAYTISQGTLGNSNYAINYVGANLSVTPRPLTVTADAQSRIYGDANPATGKAAGNNLVNGDSIASVGLTSPATPASNVGSYDLTGSAATFGSGLASNYAITYSTRPNGLVVIARPLTVTADDQFRFQGFANPALTYRIGGSGLVNGDVLAGGLATSADMQSIAGSYDITRGTLAAGANYRLTYQGAVLTVLPSPAEAVLLASSIVRDNFDAVALPDDAKPVFGAPTVPTALGLGVFYADARFDKVFVCFGGSGSCFVIGN